MHRCSCIFTSDGGNVSIFAGDGTKLYKILANAIVDESGGTTYNTAADGYWDFIKFGEVIIAFNGVDAPRAWTLDSSTDFAALSGSPPTFRHAAVINNFVVTGFQPTAKTKYNGHQLIMQHHGQQELIKQI